MLSRSALSLAGAIGGATAVCAGALVLGPPGSLLGPLDVLQNRLASVRAPSPTAKAGPTAPALSSFALFGQNPTVAVSLEGIAISPRRRAALISIDGGRADWLEVGEARDGVTLVDIQAGRVTVDSDAGPKEVRLGEGAPPPSVASALAEAPAVQSSAPAAAPPLPPRPALGGPKGNL